MPDVRTSLSESSTRTVHDTFTHASLQLIVIRCLLIMGKCANNASLDATESKARKQLISHRTVARCRSAARQRVPRRAAQCEQLVCLAHPIPTHLDEKRGRRIKARRQLMFATARSHRTVARCRSIKRAKAGTSMQATCLCGTPCDTGTSR